MVKDLIVRSETIQFLEENIGDNLLNLGLGDNFWICKNSKSKNSKSTQVGFHQTKKLLHSKVNINI